MLRKQKKIPRTVNMEMTSYVAWSNCSNSSNGGNSGMVKVKPLMEQLSENRKREDSRT